jgi:hypothetical protein
MRKLIPILYFLVLPLFVYGKDKLEIIKLSCDLLVTTTYVNYLGHDKVEHLNDILTITEFGKLKIINSLSGKILSKTTAFDETNSYKDFSDSNKWDIYYNFKDEGGTLKTQLNLDRNAGVIKYSTTFLQNLPTPHVSITTDITGNCTKIDTDKKKF